MPTINHKLNQMPVRFYLCLLTEWAQATIRDSESYVNHELIIMYING